MSARDVVFLLPGFFGFDRFATFYYFADRASAALRGHLEAQLGGPVPVIPLATGPADGLSLRQQCFLDAIEQLDARFGGIRRIHIFGHSTGGLDGELLLCRQRVDGKPWTRSQRELRGRIASVTTIAAPHYGTTLATADISRFVEHPWLNRRFVGSALPAVTALATTLPDRSSASSQLLGDTGSVISFLRQLLYRRQLLADLVPSNVERLRSRNPVELDAVAITCFVTCPLPNPTPSTERANQPDPFYLFLTNHTAGSRVKTLSPEVLENIERLNREGVPVIASATARSRRPHRFDDIDNDAVVNSARQLLPRASLGAIVHADHADVLGHYDRRDPLHPQRFIKEGVFRSGAQFGDDEFFELYRRVAQVIVCAAASRPIVSVVQGEAGYEPRSSATLTQGPTP
jgi:triacylglycerol lipase